MRKIFIVSRGYTEMYEQLGRALIGEPEVEIIYDRRDPKSENRRRIASLWSRRPLRDVGDRRTPSHVEFDLRVHGWAVATVADAAPIDEVIGSPAEPGEEFRQTLPRTGASPLETPRDRDGEKVARRHTHTKSSTGTELLVWIMLGLLLNLVLFFVIAKLAPR